MSKTYSYIYKYMESNKSHFIPDKAAPERRFIFYKEGKNKAYIWFKYTLGGWNIVFYDTEKRYIIENVDHLIKICFD